MAVPTSERVKKYTNTFHGRLKELIKGAKASSKKRKQLFDLTYDDLKEIWNHQKGLCYYTNWEMSTKTKDSKLVSIERKNNQEGYTKENVVLICWSVNRAKNILLYDEFIQMCKSVSEKMK